MFPLNGTEEGNVTGVEGAVHIRHAQAQAILVKGTSTNLVAQSLHAVQEGLGSIVGGLIESLEHVTLGEGALQGAARGLIEGTVE